MTFWDKMIYDPLSFFAGKPWWYKALIVLPWALLLAGAATVWILAPGKKTSDYVERTKNPGLEKLAADTQRQIEEGRKRRAELRQKIKDKEGEITNDAREFQRTRDAIATEDFEQLKKRLYGKNRD